MGRSFWFRSHLARLLALMVLVLGLLDPVSSLADTLEDHAPGACISLAPDQDHAPLLVLTGQDVDDETSDLEQLLRPLGAKALPPNGGAGAFPPPRTLLPPHLSPPRLRPPIFHA